ncbi:MAG: leucine-rich repeat protein [Candidatus Omnitrophota bacterium]
MRKLAFCFFLLLISSLPSYSDTFGDFTYTDSGTAITITGYTGAGGAVVIPDTIAGNPVTTIGANAFQNKSAITSVAIPNSVTSIGDYAFEGCSGLTSVAIPNSVTSIDHYTFQNCSSLTSVVIPNSVTSIGQSVFNGCSGLTSVTIPNSVTSIGTYAFRGSGLTSVTIPASVTTLGNKVFFECASLTSLTVDENNPNYSSQDSVLFNKTKTTLVSYPASKTGTYEIPSSVTSIGQSAFQGCSGLTSVTIPNSVASISAYAFNSCAGLTSVSIPSSVTTIQPYAFRYCSSLTTANFYGNAPSSFGSLVFSDAASGFTIYYRAGKTGWTNPWKTYPTSVFTPMLTVAGLTGANKEYDGTTAATASGTASLSGVDGADDVTLAGTPVFMFASAEIGDGIGITTTGYSLSGAAASNYALTQPSLTANITKRSITVTAEAQSKNMGASDPHLNYRITSGSLLGADTFSGALARDPGETGGVYAIRQGTLALRSDRYILTFVGANFTITAAPVLTMTFADGSSITGNYAWKETFVSLPFTVRFIFSDPDDPASSLTVENYNLPPGATIVKQADGVYLVTYAQDQPGNVFIQLLARDPQGNSLLGSVSVEFKTAPTFTPTASPTPTFTPSPTATVTNTPEPTATPTLTPTATPTFTPTYTPTDTYTPEPTATSTNTPTATLTPTATPTCTPTATHTPLPTATPTVTPDSANKPPRISFYFPADAHANPAYFTFKRNEYIKLGMVVDDADGPYSPEQMTVPQNWTISGDVNAVEVKYFVYNHQARISLLLSTSQLGQYTLNIQVYDGNKASDAYIVNWCVMETVPPSLELSSCSQNLACVCQNSCLSMQVKCVNKYEAQAANIVVPATAPVLDSSLTTIGNQSIMILRADSSELGRFQFELYAYASDGKTYSTLVISYEVTAPPTATPAPAATNTPALTATNTPKPLPTITPVPPTATLIPPTSTPTNTPTTQPTLIPDPVPPAKVTAEQIDFVQIKIAWTTNEANTGYVIAAFMPVDKYILKFSGIIAEATGEKWFNLKPEDEGEYDFYVRGINAAGKVSGWTKAERLTVIVQSQPIAIRIYDNLSSIIDISGATDYDTLENRQLIISWEYNSNEQVSSYHIYVATDATDSQGKFLGFRSSSSTALEWKKGNISIAPAFRSGPESGSYIFRIFALRSGKTALGPYSSRMVKLAPMFIVTDNLDSFADLSNSIDYDAPDARELVFRWHHDGGDFDPANITSFHIYVQTNNAGNFAYMGRAPSTDTVLVWKKTTDYSILPAFRSGPQFGNSYKFLLYAIIDPNRHYGPFHAAGPVLFIQQ